MRLTRREIIESLARQGVKGIRNLIKAVRSFESWWTEIGR